MVSGIDLRGPVRTCVGCRTRAAKAELLRVVIGPGASVVPDPRGSASGRGAHVHPTAECVAQAERRRAFQRAFKVSQGLDLSPLRDYVSTTHSSD